MSEEIEYIIEESLSPDRYCLVHNYIVSLQQKVEQLEKENKELRDENKRIFQNVNDDEIIDKLYDLIKADLVEKVDKEK